MEWQNSLQVVYLHKGQANPPRKILQIQSYCNKLGTGSTFMHMHFPVLWIFA